MSRKGSEIQIHVRTEGWRDCEGGLTGFHVLKHFHFPVGLWCLECYRLSVPFEIKITWLYY